MVKKTVTTTTTVVTEVYDDEKKPLRVYVLIDNSSSMAPHRERTMSSVNEYLDTVRQTAKKDGIEASVSISFFSNTDSLAWNESATSKRNNAKLTFSRVMAPIERITPLTLAEVNPYGNTPLYDAVGQIIKTNMMAHKGKDENLALVIITDGEENSSQEYSSATVKSLIKECEASGWMVMYLGANQDAWAVGASMGMSQAHTATYDMMEQARAFNVAADATMRYAATSHVGAAALTDDERKAMLKTK